MKKAMFLLIGGVLASMAPVSGQKSCGTLSPHQVNSASPSEKAAFDRAEERAQQWLAAPSLHKTGLFGMGRHPCLRECRNAIPGKRRTFENSP